MAERRMFAKTVVDSDAFLDMPVSSQNLYFHLSMRADDDGFINNPKRIQRMVNASDDDLRILAAKAFIILFDNGIIVIKHWRISNYLRSDRYKATVYQEEYRQLVIKENGAYTKISGIQLGIPDDTQRETQVSIGKDSIGKDSIEDTPDKPAIPSIPSKKKSFIPPTQEDVIKYVTDKQLVINPYSFFDYYSKLDWKDNQGKQVKSWKGKAVTWDSREREKNPRAVPFNTSSSSPNIYNGAGRTMAKTCPVCGSELDNYLTCPKCKIEYDVSGKAIK